MSKIDYEIAEIVARNLRTLMVHYDLTVQGVEAGSHVEMHTINKILNQETNMAFRTAKRLGIFFGISPETLYSDKKIQLKSIESVSKMKAFYKENKLNNKYFTSKKKDTIFVYFLREVLLDDPNFQKPMQVRELAAYIKEKYNKTFNPKTMAKELARNYDKGIINRIDKTGTKARYHYSAKKTKSRKSK